MGARRLLLSELIGVHWVVFHDVGGWLFPDNPDFDSEPDELVMEFVKCLVTLWGPEHQFIAANTRNRRDFVKDLELLERGGVYDWCGLIEQRGHFIECDGPGEKGPKMQEKIALLEAQGFAVESAAFDNSYRVLGPMPKKTHRFGYQLKDCSYPEVEPLYTRDSKVRLYEADSLTEIARIVAYIHLKTLKRQVSTLSGERSKNIQRLFKREAERTAATLLAYDVDEVVARFLP